MALGRKASEAAAQPRLLEVDASMTGTLTFKDPVNLQINGRFEGTLETKGNLSIGEKAEVRATIRGEQIVIGGLVDGELFATRRIELLGSARVTGTITTPKLVVQDGAMLQGKCEMRDVKAEGGSMTAQELARYLEVDAATVLEWAQAGRLPGQQQGGTWTFERDQIDTWLTHERIK